MRDDDGVQVAGPVQPSTLQGRTGQNSSAKNVPQRTLPPAARGLRTGGDTARGPGARPLQASAGARRGEPGPGASPCRKRLPRRRRRQAGHSWASPGSEDSVKQCHGARKGPLEFLFCRSVPPTDRASLCRRRSQMSPASGLSAQW